MTSSPSGLPQRPGSAAARPASSSIEPLSSFDELSSQCARPRTNLDQKVLSRRRGGLGDISENSGVDQIVLTELRF